MSCSTSCTSPPSKPSFTIALISSSVTLFSSFVSTPVIFTANAVLFESSQTKGEDIKERKFMGLATNIETFSAHPMPIRFGTNSPNISVRYVTIITIVVLAIPNAYGSRAGICAIITAKLWANASPEYKPVKIPIKVIPIWMVERNLSGSFASFKAVPADLLPRFASVSNLAFRAETKAISDIARIPFSKIRPIIMTISIN